MSEKVKKKEAEKHMYTNTQEEFLNLLSSYLGKEISGDELKRLKEKINSATDEELSIVLEQYWGRTDSDKYLEDDLKNEMFLQISNTLGREKKREKRSIAFYLVRIAAVLLFIGLSTQLVLTSSEKNKLEQLAENTLNIRTGAGERTRIFLPDSTEVYLNSESSLSYPQSFGRDARAVKMIGEAFFKVARDEKKKFSVDLNFVTIEVLGTVFNVNSYETDDVMEVALVSGKVKVSTNEETPSVIYLNSNEKAIYDKRTGSLEVISKNVQREMAWVDNKLIFISTPIKEILPRLEKWYGVTIHADLPPHIGDDKFTGSFKNKEITDIIKILKNYYDFEYNIKGYDIHIMTSD